ncbi:MAG: DUF2516 family protein [Frankiales bacterium]|nr:DUF2516 family protein [Frankiales bacterium]
MTVLYLLLSVALFLLQVLAIADLVSRSDDDLRRVGRGTRALWFGLLITGVLLSILFRWLGLLGVLAAAYYFLDVRPRLQALRRE